MTCKDWLQSLFSASFRGVPFWVEKDEEEGGRRLVVHEFPMRDDPFVEDLGELKRTFSLTAYVASESADAESSAVVMACQSRGAAVLVLPMQGPVTVQCESVKRSRERDKHGYVAFELKFVRDGFPSALASVASLAQRVFDAAGVVSSLAGQALAAVTTTVGYLDLVANMTKGAAEDAVATLEAARSESVIDPTASAKARDALAGLFDASGLTFVRRPPSDEDVVAFLTSPRGSAVAALTDAPTTVAGWGAGLVEAARSLGDGMAPETAYLALADVVRLDPTMAPTGTTPASRQVAANLDALARTLRLAGLTVMAEAAIRRDYESRQDAIAVRAELAERFEREQNTMTGAAYAELFVAVENLRGLVVAALSRRILDLAPIVTVEARISMPSLWWSWRLHQNPARAIELVRRNRVVAPSMMPLKFEALSDRPSAR